jgi:hypothetical protein
LSTPSNLLLQQPTAGKTYTLPCSSCPTNENALNSSSPAPLVHWVHFTSHIFHRVRHPAGRCECKRALLHTRCSGYR